MNGRLRKKFDFFAGLVRHGEYITNMYSVSVSFMTTSQDQNMQNIAYDRMTFWFDQIMHDCVLMQENDESLAAHKKTGRKILALPYDPIDSAVGIMLFRKISAITENRLMITDVDISSQIGGELLYQHNEVEQCDLFEQAGWWNDHNPVWQTQKKQTSKSKIISLERELEWSDLDLDWKKDNTASSGVVFANFSRDETK